MPDVLRVHEDDNVIIAVKALEKGSTIRMGVRKLPC